MREQLMKTVLAEPPCKDEIVNLFQVSAGDMAWGPMREEFTTVLVEPPRKEIKMQMQRDLAKLSAHLPHPCPPTPAFPSHDPQAAVADPAMAADDRSCPDQDQARLDQHENSTQSSGPIHNTASSASSQRSNKQHLQQRAEFLRVFQVAAAAGEVMKCSICHRLDFS